MAVDRGRRGGFAGISLGGILVIVGIVVAPAWSLVLGISIALIGLSRSAGLSKASGTSPEPNKRSDRVRLGTRRSRAPATPARAIGARLTQQ